MKKKGKKGPQPTMKATGYVRKVDNIGMIVLPVDLRRELDMNVTI